MERNGFRTLAAAWLLPLTIAAGLLGCNDSSPRSLPAAPAGKEAGQAVSQTDGQAAVQLDGKKQERDAAQTLRLPAGVPAKVGRVLQYIDKYDRPPESYEGGRSFGNHEGLLPQKDARGRAIHYREWDVNPKIPGKNRGPERLVTGSDGSACYTADHYQSFIKIR